VGQSLKAFRWFFFLSPVAALKNNGASGVAAAFAVWAVAPACGAMLSVGYAVFLLTKNKSWGVFLDSQSEFWLATLIGVNIAVSVALVGNGMLLMGALGGSIGAGLQQISWMLGGQGIGFFSGEWSGVNGRPRTHILFSVGLLFLAALIMACGNFTAQSEIPSGR
jgi:L-rhamnose-H+ transport protein